MNKILVCLFSLAVLVACHSSKKSKPAAKPRPKPKTTTSVKPPKPEETTITVGGVVFQNSEFLSPILEKAQKEKKPVFLEMHAAWCAPCKMMEEDVFTQKPVFNYLNANFLNFRADFDAPNGKTIAGIYEIKGLPTMIFLDPNGVVLERQLGAAGYSDIKKMGDAALAKMKK